MIYNPCDLSDLEQVALWIYGDAKANPAWNWLKRQNVKFPERNPFEITPGLWGWRIRYSIDRYALNYALEHNIFTYPVI